jgi:flavin reductase (DIM6/NTAB) family NADH-FMN oxidoreductase RutF
MNAVTNAVAAPGFADAMSRWASGVVLVTCRVAGRPWGMTATAFASVAAAPPTVLVSLGSRTAAARAIAARGGFGVSVLAAGQEDVAEHGAASGAAKFLDSLVELHDRDRESPVVAGALAHLDCTVVAAVEAADHTVFFGHVNGIHCRPGGEPLLYHGRGYGRFERAGPERSLRCISS